MLAAVGHINIPWHDTKGQREREGDCVRRPSVWVAGLSGAELDRT